MRGPILTHLTGLVQESHPKRGLVECSGWARVLCAYAAHVSCRTHHTLMEFSLSIPVSTKRADLLEGREHMSGPKLVPICPAVVEPVPGKVAAQGC